MLITELVSRQQNGEEITDFARVAKTLPQFFIVISCIINCIYVIDRFISRETIEKNDNSIVIEQRFPPQVNPYAIYATRMFAGPGQYPPSKFKAYGIIAFKGGPTESEKHRFETICDAYTNAIVFYKSKQAVPIEEQMVTVWPVETDALASKINAMKHSEVCQIAISKYNIAMAQTAIMDAKLNSANLEGRGPFLLAWAPGEDKGKSEKLVLVADLSNVETDLEANDFFYMWREKITMNPGLWYPNWDVESIKRQAALWLNYWGRKVLDIFGEKNGKEDSK